MNAKKQIAGFILVSFILAFLTPQNVPITSAAANATVYEYSPIVEDKGNIYYVQTLEGDKYSYDIYQMEISTGNKTRLISSKYDILNMMVHDNTLYYTCYEREKEVDQTYSVSIEGNDKKTICNGALIYLDDSSIYYTVNKGEKSRLYKRAYNGKKADLIYTGNLSFRFVKSLDDTLYFSEFKEVSSKLTLYTLMPGRTKLAVLTTDKITLNETERTWPTVSDVVKINGDIYYQYGAHEGSGSYWYGTLKKLDSGTNKKSVIAKQLYEEQIYYNDNSIFYNGTESEGKHYRYHTKTGKTSSYIYKTQGTESFNILGDQTYCAKADGKEWVTISRFTSGTNKTNLVKSFIHFSYQQEKELDYYACVKKYGDFLLIPVTCMDYNDTTYGWRGRCVSVTWYVADSDGKILAQFQ